ncbi:hypothetical protein PsorP6_009032 [Peronosclerospora sorghi]|uniref:Uncharacterized protein n=1 Tax=Peronosclerospora sorghi TaxID=230839 RepID=A0ACC0VY56_9STRA|nr:hypothetical protein PsorP6_009032 [Peronosclerospora sorghi]
MAVETSRVWWHSQQTATKGNLATLYSAILNFWRNEKRQPLRSWRTNSGWKAAEPTGPIPEEGFFSKIVDTVIEWSAEHTSSAGLLARSRRCVAVQKNTEQMEGEKEEDGKEDKLPPPTPYAIEAKKSGQKPKD